MDIICIPGFLQALFLTFIFVTYAGKQLHCSQMCVCSKVSKQPISEYTLFSSLCAPCKGAWQSEYGCLNRVAQGS